MATTQRALPLAGWYADPRDPARLRWWDGRGWTPHVRPRVPQPRRRARSGWWMSLLAILVVVVTTFTSTGLLAQLTQSTEAWLGPDSFATLPAPPAAPEPPVASAADLERALQGVVMVRAACGTGCSAIGGSVAVGPSELLTAAHVVEQGGTVLAVTEAGEALEAEVVLTAAGPDLALLRTSRPHGLPTVALRPDEPVIGEEAWAAGYPGSERRVSGGSVTDIVDLGGDGILEVQTDARIDQGNSGGPLLDAQGRLLGIVVQEHQTDDTIGWATGASAVALFLAEALGMPAAEGAGPLFGTREYGRQLDDIFRGLEESP